MKIGIDEAVNITITTKWKNSTLQTVDDFKLPVIVGESTTNSNGLNLVISLMKDEKLEATLEAINKSKDKIESLSVKINDKEALTFQPNKD